MEKYLILKKEQGVGQIYVRDKKLVFDKEKTEILRKGVQKLWSVDNMKNDIIALYETDENEFFAGVIMGGKLKSEKMLFKNRNPLSCALAWSENGLKLFSAEEDGGETVVSQRTITSEGTESKVLCKTKENKKTIRLFSFEKCSACVYRTEKGIEAVNCRTDEVFSAENDIIDYSACIIDGKIYVLCVLKNSVVLYTADGNKRDIFKGGAHECAAAVFNGRLYLSAKDSKKIYIRNCGINDMRFSSMGSIPADEHTKKAAIVGDMMCCGEFFDSGEVIEMFKKLVPLKTEEKVVVMKKESERNIFNEVLSRNIAEISAQNSMLNLRAKNMHERYVSQIKALEEENLRLAKENEKLRQEKELLKNAKKLLEDEIYRLNSLRDGGGENKVIDNDEKN